MEFSTAQLADNNQVPSYARVKELGVRTVHERAKKMGLHSIGYVLFRPNFSPCT